MVFDDLCDKKHYYINTTFDCTNEWSKSYIEWIID